MHLILSIFLLILSGACYGMNFLKEYQIIDDKLDFTNRPPPEKLFFWESNVHLNYDYKQVQHDINQLNSDPNEERITSFIDRYDGKIKNIKANSKIGFRLLNLKTDKITWRTYLQGSYDYTVSALVYKKTLSFGDIEKLFPETIPQDLKNYIKTLSPGDDIIAKCQADPSLSPQSRALCKTYPEDTYFIPQPDQEVPNLVFLSKKDMKLGLYNYFKNGSFFGSLNIYALRREDLYRLITPDQLKDMSPDIFTDKVGNSEDTLQLDYTFGYYGKIHSAFISFEEMKLSTWKKRDKDSKPMFYPYTSLVKVQTNSKYPLHQGGYVGHFLGMQNRNYNFVDGVYGGMMFGCQWRSNLVELTAMYNRYYWSFTPRIVYSFLSLEYGYKMPSHTNINGLQLTPIQSLNLGVSF